MANSTNTYKSLKPNFKEIYGKPAKGVSLRTLPEDEDVNKVPKNFGFKKLKNLIKI